MRFYAILMSVVFGILGCVPEYENPIDPQNPEAILPQAKLGEITLIPYKDTKVYHGEFEFTWENANGLLLKVSRDNAAFETLDTILPVNGDFNFSVSDQDSANYKFKLVAFNDYGLGRASNVGVSSGLDTVDLFAPTLDFSSSDLQIGESWISQKSSIVLKLQFWDESDIKQIIFDGEELVFSPGRQGTISKTLNLNNFSNQYVVQVKDDSPFARVTLDTIDIKWDVQNKPYRLKPKPFGGKVHFSWDASNEVDFKQWKLWVSTTGVPDTTSEPTYWGSETEFQSSISKASDYYAILGLEDSLGQTYFSPNSKVQTTLRGCCEFIYLVGGSGINGDLRMVKPTSED